MAVGNFTKMVNDQLKNHGRPPRLSPFQYFTMQGLQLKLVHRESSIGQDSRLLKMVAAVQKSNYELHGLTPT